MSQYSQRFSEREGVSLNQFINVAVAEKLAHLEHDEWLARRAKPNAASITRALEIPKGPSRRKPEPGDQLSKGYTSILSK
jgi:hypothetical protein